MYIKEHKIEMEKTAHDKVELEAGKKNVYMCMTTVNLYSLLSSFFFNFISKFTFKINLNLFVLDIFAVPKGLFICSMIDKKLF